MKDIIQSSEGNSRKSESDTMTSKKYANLTKIQICELLMVNKRHKCLRFISLFNSPKFLLLLFRHTHSLFHLSIVRLSIWYYLNHNSQPPRMVSCCQYLYIYFIIFASLWSIIKGNLVKRLQRESVTCELFWDERHNYRLYNCITNTSRHIKSGHSVGCI